MVTVPKNADDMMNVGRLQGFEGRITAQGRLLMQDTILVNEPEDAKQKKDKQIKVKERRVFLFQQIIIFSEMIGSTKKFTSPRYIFKSDMKVNNLQLQKDDTNMSFTLLQKTPESNKKIVCQCEDIGKYNQWISQLQDLLDMQNRFLRDLQHPQLAMQKTHNSSVGNNLSSSTSPKSSKNSQNNDGQHHHHSITSTLNDFLKNTFSFSSSNSSSNNNNNNNNSNSSSSSMSAAPSPSSVSSSKNTSNNGLSSVKSAPLNLTNNSNATTNSPLPANSNMFFTGTSSNNNENSVDCLNAELSQQLSLDNQRKGSNSSIPNCAKVVNAYAAITEDEISVQKGDVVQIITANMHNRFLVHREANEHQPAAEGWIPGFVIGYQSTNLA